MKEKVTVIARGHPLIRAEHKTTLEITKDEHLTPKGDCIVGVGADKALKDFPESFKKLAKRRDAKIKVVLQVGEDRVVITGRGDEKLSFTHPSDIVIRKSTYTCPRTLMVEASHSAKELPREFVEKLKDSKTVIHVTIVVEAK